jgi:hypothetical protein
MSDDVPTATAPLGGSSDITPMLWGAAADVPPLLGPAGVAHMSILDFAKWGSGTRAKESGDPRLSSRRRSGASTNSTWT